MKLHGRPQGIAPTVQDNATDVFSHNYELRITNYELIITVIKIGHGRQTSLTPGYHGLLLV